MKNSEDSTKDEHREQTQHTRKYTYISVLSARKVPFNIFHLGRHVFFRSKQTAKMNETAIVLGSGLTFAASLRISMGPWSSGFLPWLDVMYYSIQNEK